MRNATTGGWPYTTVATTARSLALRRRASCADHPASRAISCAWLVRYEVRDNDARRCRDVFGGLVDVSVDDG